MLDIDDDERLKNKIHPLGHRQKMKMPIWGSL